MDCPHIPKIPYSEFSEHIHNKVALGRLPLDGTIEITLRCNLRCVHCYCNDDPLKKEMSFKEICRVLDEITDAGCLWLLFTGGEPLLRPDFIDIYTYAKKKGLIITLFTNATLITPYIADYLKDYPPFVIEITLYGITKQTYEQVTAMPGSYERCMEGIRLIRQRNLPLKLKTMVTSLNKHELWQIKAFAEESGVDFRFDPVLNPRIDGSRGPCQFRISPQEVVGLDLADAKRSEEWKRFCEEYCHLDFPDKLFACQAGVTSFHIDPYGQLQLCGMVRQFSYSMPEGSFKEGWDDALLRFRSRKEGLHQQCKKCEAIHICDLCPGWSQLENNDLGSPVEYLCEIAHLRAQAFMTENRKVKQEV